MTGGISQSDAGARRAMLAHVLPFVAWIVALALPGGPWNYAARSAAALVLLAWLRPWRWYAPPRMRAVPAAILAGVGVAVLWIGPESAWLGRQAPALHGFYARYGILRVPGGAAGAGGAAFAPELGGWPLALARLAGSAFVIAVIEEFFWRGFLYRWWQKPAFLAVDPRRFAPGAFVGTAALFAVEHDRWLAGLAAGAIYGLVALRGGIWAAAIAHVTTNLLLGLYVLACGAYRFW